MIDMNIYIYLCFAGLLTLQRNVRAWCTLRTWEWFKLYGRVKPMLKAGKITEEMEKLTDQIKQLEQTLQKEEGNRKDLEKQVSFFTYKFLHYHSLVSFPKKKKKKYTAK